MDPVADKLKTLSDFSPSVSGAAGCRFSAENSPCILLIPFGYMGAIVRPAYSPDSSGSLEQVKQVRGLKIHLVFILVYFVYVGAIVPPAYSDFLEQLMQIHCLKIHLVFILVSFVYVGQLSLQLLMSNPTFLMSQDGFPQDIELSEK